MGQAGALPTEPQLTPPLLAAIIRREDKQSICDAPKIIQEIASYAPLRTKQLKESQGEAGLRDRLGYVTEVCE